MALVLSEGEAERFFPRTPSPAPAGPDPSPAPRIGGKAPSQTIPSDMRERGLGPWALEQIKRTPAGEIPEPFPELAGSVRFRSPEHKWEAFLAQARKRDGIQEQPEAPLAARALGTTARIGLPIVGSVAGALMGGGAGTPAGPGGMLMGGWKGATVGGGLGGAAGYGIDKWLRGEEMTARGATVDTALGAAAGLIPPIRSAKYAYGALRGGAEGGLIGYGTEVAENYPNTDHAAALKRGMIGVLMGVPLGMLGVRGVKNQQARARAIEEAAAEVAAREAAVPRRRARGGKGARAAAAEHMASTESSIGESLPVTYENLVAARARVGPKRGGRKKQMEPAPEAPAAEAPMAPSAEATGPDLGSLLRGEKGAVERPVGLARLFGIGKKKVVDPETGEKVDLDALVPPRWKAAHIRTPKGDPGELEWVTPEGAEGIIVPRRAMAGPPEPEPLRLREPDLPVEPGSVGRVRMGPRPDLPPPTRERVYLDPDVVVAGPVETAPRGALKGFMPGRPLREQVPEGKVWRSKPALAHPLGTLGERETTRLRRSERTAEAASRIDKPPPAAVGLEDAPASRTLAAGAVRAAEERGAREFGLARWWVEKDPRNRSYEDFLRTGLAKDKLGLSDDLREVPSLAGFTDPEGAIQEWLKNRHVEDLVAVFDRPRVRLRAVGQKQEWERGDVPFERGGGSGRSAAAFEGEVTGVSRPPAKPLRGIRMWSKAERGELREDLRARYPRGTSTVSMIEDGVRHATTRRPFAQVGEEFTIEGVAGRFRVIAIRPPSMWRTPKGRDTWSRLEGWDASRIEALGLDRPDFVQTVFRRVPEKRMQHGAAPKAPVPEVASAMGRLKSEKGSIEAPTGLAGLLGRRRRKGPEGKPGAAEIAAAARGAPGKGRFEARAQEAERSVYEAAGIEPPTPAGPKDPRVPSRQGYAGQVSGWWERRLVAAEEKWKRREAAGRRRLVEFASKRAATTGTRDNLGILAAREKRVPSLLTGGDSKIGQAWGERPRLSAKDWDSLPPGWSIKRGDSEETRAVKTLAAEVLWRMRDVVSAHRISVVPEARAWEEGIRAVAKLMNRRGWRSVGEMKEQDILSLRIPGQSLGDAGSAALTVMQHMGTAEFFRAYNDWLRNAKHPAKELMKVFDLGNKIGLLATQSVADGAAAGRALQFRKRLNQVNKAVLAGEIKDSLEVGKAMGVDVGQYAAVMSFLQGNKGDRVDLDAVRMLIADMARGGTKPEQLYEAWLNLGLLSGPVTQVVNVAGNVIALGLRPASTAVAAGGDFLRASFTGSKREVHAAEVWADLWGAYNSLGKAWEDAMVTWKSEIPQFNIANKVYEREAGNHFGMIPGDFGTVIRMPGRFLMAMDDFFKAANYHGRRSQMAYRAAARQGLKDEDRWVAMHRYLNDPGYRIGGAEIEDILGMSMEDLGVKEALYRTYTSDLGEWGRKLIQLRETPGAGGWAMKVLLPFIRTPVNLIKFGLDHSPVGVVRELMRLAKQSPEDFVGQRAEKLAAGVIGSMMAFGALYAASQGVITGAGAYDPVDKQKERLGSEPYSIYLGNGRWVSYARLDPIAGWLGVAADVYEMWDILHQENAVEKLTGSLLTAPAHSLLSKTWIKGITDAALAWSRPDIYGERWTQSLGGTVIPAGVGQITRAVDPVVRDTRGKGVLGSIMSRLPMTSEFLPSFLDVFGRDVTRGSLARGPFLGTLERMVSPFPTVKVPDDVPSREYVRLTRAGHEIHPGSIEGTLRVDGIDLALPPEMRHEFRRLAGQRWLAAMEGVVRGGTWGAMTDAQKANAFRFQSRAARHWARSEMRRLHRVELREGEELERARQGARAKEYFRRGVERFRPEGTSR